MWESIGFIIAFGYSAELCTSVKLYILTGMLIAGNIGYFIVEYRLQKDKIHAFFGRKKVASPQNKYKTNSKVENKQDMPIYAIDNDAYVVDKL